jgi:hypothetical protein
MGQSSAAAVFSSTVISADHTLTADPEMNRRPVIRRDLLRAEVARKRRDLRCRGPREGERRQGPDQHYEHGSSPPVGDALSGRFAEHECGDSRFPVGIPCHMFPAVFTIKGVGPGTRAWA